MHRRARELLDHLRRGVRRHERRPSELELLRPILIRCSGAGDVGFTPRHVRDEEVLRARDAQCSRAHAQRGNVELAAPDSR